MRGEEPKGRHDRLVLQTARSLQQRFYRSIRSRVGSFDPPDPIQINGGAYTPDVTMVNRNDVLHLLEVETPEALENGIGPAKWRAISEYAAKRGAAFYLVVPEESRAKAVSRLEHLNLQANVWGLRKSKQQFEED